MSDDSWILAEIADAHMRFDEHKRYLTWLDYLTLNGELTDEMRLAALSIYRRKQKKRAATK